MLSRTRKVLLKGINKELKKRKLKLQDIKDKEKNPFPVSPRWIDNLIYADKHDTAKTFNFDTCETLANFLNIPNKRDGSVLVITNRKKTEDNETN